VKKVGVEAELVAEIYEAALDKLYLDQLQSLSGAICWLSSATRALNLTSLSLAVEEGDVTLDLLQLHRSPGSGRGSGSNSHGRDSSGDSDDENDDSDQNTTEAFAELIRNALRLVEGGYSDTLPKLIAGLGEGILRTAINREIAKYFHLHNSSMHCVPHKHKHRSRGDVTLPMSTVTNIDASESTLMLAGVGNSSGADGLINWADSSITRIINPLSASLTDTGLRSFADCATDGTGALALQFGRIQISLDGLDAFFNTSLLRPAAVDQRRPHDLRNSIGMGRCRAGDEDGAYDPLVLTVTFPHGHELSLSLSNLLVNLDATVGVSEAALDAIQLKQLLGLQSWRVGTDTNSGDSYYGVGGPSQAIGCVFSAVQELSVASLGMSVGKAVLHLKGRGIPTEAVDITEIANHLLGQAGATDTLAKVNRAAGSWRKDVAEQCAGSPHHKPKTPPDSDAALDLDESVLITSGLVVAIAASIMSLYWYWYWNLSEDSGCGCGSGSKAKTRASDSAKSDAVESEVGGDRGPFKGAALAVHPSIHPILRALIPLVLLCNLVLFVISNGSTEAVSVFVHANVSPGDAGDFDGKKHRGADPFWSATFPIFYFGLTSTVREMWQANVKTLAVLVALFSGVWPYLKLLALLLCWMSPTSGGFSVRKRGSLLMAVDAFGKWSLVDFFVMVLMMCAFYLDLPIPVDPEPGSHGTPNVKASVNVIVQPNEGFYCFLVATIVSLVVGHVILAMHRYVVATEKKLISGRDTARNNDTLCPLLSHKYPISQSLTVGREDLFLVTITVKGEKAPRIYAQLTALGKAVALLVLVSSVGFVALGLTRDTMIFRVKGLTGYLLGDAANVRYSMVSVGRRMAYKQADPWGMAFLQVSYFVFGLATPVALIGLVAVLWLCPLPRRLARKLRVATEITSAWAALDVFCVSIAAALLEIGQFAAFAVGSKCRDINYILANGFDAPLHLRGDDKCFDVAAYLLPVSAQL
jgi:hypothetical protein